MAGNECGGAIHKLDESVVNRIAAGEVLQRPANAVKEMVENSLDAGAASITVSCKNGGLKLLQVVDTGKGIPPEDFPLLCERFATSKLSKFEDLQSIATYGFRGEALASISHVAHFRVTSKTASAECAYRASFEEGKMTTPTPAPCAGVNGTTMTVEDLFYNTPVRLKALSKPADEYQRIVEVMTRYALHNSGVAFACKKHGENASDVRTARGASVVENVRALFGHTVARELVEVTCSDDKIGLASCKAWVTKANFNLKKTTHILFINNRLVDCAPLKKAVDAVYQQYLVKGSHPWVYMALAIKPSNVDVNVHPTKSEVRFLFEAEIVEAIQKALSDALSSHDASRTFDVRTVSAPSARVPSPDLVVADDTAVSPASVTVPAGDPPAMTSPPRPSVVVVNKAPVSPSEFAMATPIPRQPPSPRHDRQSPRPTPPSPLRSPPSPRPVASSSSTSVTQQQPQQQQQQPQAGHPTAQVVQASPAKVPVSQNRMVRNDPSVRTLDSFVQHKPPPSSMDGPAPLPPLVPQHRDDAAMADGDGTAVVGIEKATQSSMFATAPSAIGRSDTDTQAAVTNNPRAGTQLDDNRANKRMAPDVPDSEPASAPRRRPRKYKPCSLTSVHTVIARLESKSHTGLEEVLVNCSFVGFADSTFVLVQHRTKLYICNAITLCQELMFQQVFMRFGNFDRLTLKPSIGLRDLLTAARDCPAVSSQSRTVDVGACYDTIMRMREMIAEYFAIEIAEDGALTALPQIVDGYVPDMAYLPLFVHNLATRVEWQYESECFETIARRLSEFYAPKVPLQSVSCDSGTQTASGGSIKSFEWTMQHSLFPSVRSLLYPPRSFATDGTFVQVASLENLYRVFERC